MHEYTYRELMIELSRRLALIVDNRCDYCERDVAIGQVCRYPARHVAVPKLKLTQLKRLWNFLDKC